MHRVPLNPTKRNFIANIVGSGWGTLAGLVCTPLFIRFLGMEAYGLIGFFLTMQAVIQILDMGLSPTMNREMARYSVLPEKAGEARDFVRTLEIGYWAIGILIGIAITSAAPFIASRWINAARVPVAEVQRAVTIMGILAALQWPFSFYQGGLLGLQRHVQLNVIMIVTSTLGNLGAVFVLWKISPTVTAFFYWQIAVYSVQVGLATAVLWRCLPAAERPARIVPGLARGVGKFAAGMSGISITALVLTQMDKIILSTLLDLKTFGYYMLASVIGNGLLVLVNPTFNTVYPRFCALVAVNDETSLREIYHGSSQIMAALVLPAAAMIALFPREILDLWIGNREVTRHVAPIASILVAGTALNGMMHLPVALQLSYGWTRIGLSINSVFILTLVPTVLYMSIRYGAIGAATVWFALNSIYMVVGVPLTHRRLLKGESVRWLTRDFLFPLAGASLVVIAGRAMFAAPTGKIETITLLIVLTLLGFAGATAAAPMARSSLLGSLK